MITYLKYVAHSLVEKHLAAGWVLSDDLSGTTHGQYSVLMQWTGEGEPPL